jgi:hypothetical protein
MEIYKNKNIEDMLYETWADVLSFEGLYKISSFGRVKSVRKNVIMFQRLHKRGYLSVGLYNKGEKRMQVHRLVGIQFVPNPDNKPQINHEFGDKKDNRWFMLGWMNNSENHKHAYDVLGRKSINEGKKGVLSAVSKEVYQYDKGRNFIAKFVSHTEAAKCVNGSAHGIGNVVNGIQKTSGGFIWRAIYEQNS